jgi:hypothetical protein
MTYETQARMQLGYKTDYELNRLTNGFGINDPSLNQSPLSEGKLTQMAQDELSMREDQRAPPLEPQDSLLDDY